VRTPDGALLPSSAIALETEKTDGKISKTYHMENWLSALGQLRSQ